jgi:hypothetical protein
MTEVAPIKMPSLEGKRLSFALAEDRLAHYPEFRDFFVRTFDLDRKGLSEPGFVRAPSGNAYALIFIGRSGLPFHQVLNFMPSWMPSSRSMGMYWIAISGRFCDG